MKKFPGSLKMEKLTVLMRTDRAGIKRSEMTKIKAHSS